MSNETQAIILGIVRHAIGTLGGILVAHGIPALTGGQMDSVAGGVMVLIAVGWSWYHKTTVRAK
jgi:hypothetical protein